jgi:hypothetical protein
MITRTITLQLPDDIYRRLERMAEATHQPLEEVVVQTIQGNLPPSVDDLPADLQGEMAALQNVNDEALWAIAKETLPIDQWRRHQALLRKNGSRGLSDKEREELSQLRHMADRLVLRRSYALALLKWRGHTLPAA